MGRSSKVARVGNFATHKKSVRKRTVVDKRTKSSGTPVPAAAAAAPKAAKKDTPAAE
jgi:hypothetical protein